MKTLHFIRKKAQLRASFIKNQITHHIDYQPIVVFRQNRIKGNEGGFAEFDFKHANFLDLSEDETPWEKLLYKFFKKISDRQAKRIEQFIIDKQIAVLHFHYGTDAGFFIPFLKKTSLPSFVSFYGYDCSSFPRFYWGCGKYYLKRRVFPFVTKVFAMSEDMKDDLMSLGCPESRIIVHYHGIDVSLFKNIERRAARTNETKLLILSGLDPKKGHFFLLQALKKLIESGRSDFSLRIVGSGPLERKLRDFVQQSDLSSKVIFAGAVKHGSAAMFEELSNADLFVHPSVTDIKGDKEGIPGSIAEAMAAGLPVISTFHAGIPFIIENERTGLLVKEWDIEALAGAIEKLISDSELRRKLGAAAKNYAVKNLDIADKELELEKYYNSLI